MNRPTATLLGLVCLAGCEDRPASPAAAPRERSAAVVATAPAAAAAPAASSAAAPAAPRKVLCAEQLGRPARELAPTELARAGEGSHAPAPLATGDGAWTWINLWAAWCVPCKEELPRLLGFQRSLAGEKTPLRVAFVSLDDDGRQLQAFLERQPADGLRSTFWAEDGPARAKLLADLGFEGEPELPAHVLVDPSGKIRCRQLGAVESADEPEIRKILRGERGGRGGGAQKDGHHGHAPASGAAKAPTGAR